MINKEKAFTMIEILATVVILAIIMLIAVPLVSRYIRQSELEYYNSTAELVRTAGREYYADNFEVRPKEIGNISKVSLETLVNEHHLEQYPKSKKNNKCSGEVITKKKVSGEYEYYLCFLCDDFEIKEDDELCKKDSQISNYEIEVPLDYTVEQNKEFIPKVAKVYNNGELIVDNLLPIPTYIDTYKLGSTELVYNYKGVSASIFVSVVDVIKPVAPSLTLKVLDNDLEKSYVVGNYTNKTIRIYSSSSDGVGSGISHFLFSENENGPWESSKLYLDVTKNKTGNHTYYVKAVDNYGNESEASSVLLSFDFTAPSIPNVVGMSTSCVYKNNYSITFTSSDTHSGLSGYQIDINNDGVADSNVNTPYVPLNNFSSCNVRFRAVDKVGNYSAWSVAGHIHQDTEKPVMTELMVVKSDGSVYTSGSTSYLSVTMTPSATDNFGISKYIYSTDEGVTWKDMANSLEISTDTNLTYRVKAVDKAGNISDNYKEIHIVLVAKITKYRTQNWVSKTCESCSSPWTVCGSVSRTCASWSRTVDGFPESNPINGWTCGNWPNDVSSSKYCCSYSVTCPCCTGKNSSNCQPQSDGTCAGNIKTCTSTDCSGFSGTWSSWTTTPCVSSSTLKCESKKCLASSANGKCDV